MAFSRESLKLLRPLYSLPLRLLPRRARFALIHRANLWRDRESVSGPGSNTELTAAVREALPPLLEELGCRSLLDVACGDCFWISQLELPVERYIGAEIVPALVERNQARLGNAQRSFVQLDLVRDELPEVDLVLCRDCLVHLSNDDVRAALANVARSGATWLLTTTFPERERNADILSGEWRPLNLTRAPFSLPPPERLIDERCSYEGGRWLDKSLGLWRVAQLASASGG